MRRGKNELHTLGEGRIENVDSILSGYSYTYSHEGSDRNDEDEHNFSEFG